MTGKFPKKRASNAIWWRHDMSRRAKTGLYVTIYMHVFITSRKNATLLLLVGDFVHISVAMELFFYYQQIAS